ncbi:FAD-binding oxidoreductase [Streptomyces sp. NPDC093085]|uniref:FAD-binding oxidoreductase n=1 Tax=Streptomyces sp. NPDC093085 TaxID=3155068 RepID=UPI0034416FA2
MERRTLLTAAAGAAATATLTACSGAGNGADPGSGADRTAGAAGPPTGPAPARTTAATGAPSSAPSAPDWTALARTLDGELIRPGDAAYATARQLYNTRYDHLRPAALAYVAGEDDITECLAFARAHATPVAIRGGGHSYAGWSSGDGRLVIDVSKLASVSYGAQEARVGAGARLSDVYRTLAAHGRTVPAGSCPTVGVAGLTLGGGHGVTSRAYGLTCDNLLSATVVTADGRRLTTDARRNTDLFWALRGAGNGTFGVVTELRFRTHPAPTVAVARASWPWSKAETVLAAWQEWGPGQPDEIWSALHFSADPGGSTPQVSLSVLSLGTESGLRNAVDRLADGPGGPGPARSVSVRSRGYHEAMLGYAGCSGLTPEQCRLPGTTPGRSPEGALGRETYAAASDFFDRSLPAPGRRALLSAVEAFTRLPASGGGAGSIALTALGGAVNRVDPAATAFVHRRSRMLAQYLGAWRPAGAGGAGSPGAEQRKWLKTTHAAMRRYASGAAYQNYADPTLADWRSAYYGTGAERLTRLKRRYDPDRLFDFPQAL